MVDRSEDMRIGVKSTAILFGDADRFFIGIIQVLMLGVLVLIGRKAGMHVPYYAGIAVAGALAAYQQHLIRDRDPGKCFRAFLNNNYLGLAVFAGIAADYWSR
jgi:4-hydroxybenzoate polyprenyltransferase